MGEMNGWAWLVTTDKGDFFVMIAGEWTQGQAFKHVCLAFGMLGLDITAMISRKRAPTSVAEEAMVTIYQETDHGEGFSLLAGKKLWNVCGQGIHYEAEMIRLKKEMV